MKPDDEICYCYHVSLRKLVNFARRERPARASLMTRCLGAGTGCGWCIPFLKRIAETPDAVELRTLEPTDYAADRKSYITNKDPRNSFEGT